MVGISIFSPDKQTYISYGSPTNNSYIYQTTAYNAGTPQWLVCDLFGGSTEARE